MIKSNEKFRIFNTEEREIFKVEVNWEDKELTNKCKVLRIIFPDGKVEYVKKEVLLGLLVSIGKSNEIEQIMPLKTRRMKWYETTLGVKATKDIKKGEMISFPVKLELPATEEELLGLKKRSASGLVIPK